MSSGLVEPGQQPKERLASKALTHLGTNKTMRWTHGPQSRTDWMPCCVPNHGRLVKHVRHLSRKVPWLRILRKRQWPSRCMSCEKLVEQMLEQLVREVVAIVAPPISQQSDRASIFGKHGCNDKARTEGHNVDHHNRRWQGTASPTNHKQTQTTRQVRGRVAPTVRGAPYEELADLQPCLGSVAKKPETQRILHVTSPEHLETGTVFVDSPSRLSDWLTFFPAAAHTASSSQPVTWGSRAACDLCDQPPRLKNLSGTPGLAFANLPSKRELASHVRQEEQSSLPLVRSNVLPTF